eukprot:NODE_270_length_12222_cov_0.321868.p8 type:complete len:101 gc:universal NODE_270_length_12222_cov_0.321868:5111-4809(-)
MLYGSLLIINLIESIDSSYICNLLYKLHCSISMQYFLFKLTNKLLLIHFLITFIASRTLSASTNDLIKFRIMANHSLNVQFRYIKSKSPSVCKCELSMSA